MKLGLILAAVSTAVWSSGAANCPARNNGIGQSMVQMKTRIKKVDRGTHQVEPHSAPVPTMHHAKIKSLGHAMHHASSRARWVQVRDDASVRMDAVSRLESGVAGEPSSIVMLQLQNGTQKATYHSAASATHNRSLNEARTNETRAVCRACADADRALMKSLQLARDLHATAQTLALAVADAAHKHEAASANFVESHDSFKDTLRQLQEYKLTYKSSEGEFDKLISWVKELQSGAQETVGNENDKITHAKAEDKAQKEYRDAAAAAQRADEEVAANMSAAGEACAALGLAPVEAVPAPAPQVAQAPGMAWNGVCYNSRGGRPLHGRGRVRTVADCIYKAKGYKYFGLGCPKNNGGFECWRGNSISSGAKKIDMKECMGTPLTNIGNGARNGGCSGFPSGTFTQVHQGLTIPLGGWHREPVYETSLAGR